MCTLSWFRTPLSYHIFFNRDESRQRSVAIAPQDVTSQQVTAQFPIDPDGNGTWIFTNSKGLSSCLLNRYLATDLAHSDNRRSRGLLMKDITFCDSVVNAEQLITEQALENYNSFDIFLFDPHQTKQLSWSGFDLTTTMKPSQFYCSSAVEPTQTQHSRFELYQNIQKAKDETANSLTTQHRQLHQSHLPEKSSLSVCMHRHDAKTVSYTEINVGKQVAKLAYQSGSPCSQAPLEQYQLQI